MTEPEAPPVPAVIVSVPAKLGAVDILIRHQPWGAVEVDLRPLGTSVAWIPASHIGASFVVRP